jgi:hypothetical protein
LTCCNMAPTLGAMGRHVERTAAEELAEAKVKLDAAFLEMRNWHAHLQSMADHPLDSEPSAHQARRSARIVAALITEAETRTQAAHRCTVS